MGLAYWCKGNKIIKVGSQEYKIKVSDMSEGGITHIHDLVENPEVFGFSKKEIEDTYNKYNEEIGSEGKAREEIISKAMANGWIRMRFNTSRSGQYWTIQFDDYVKRKKQLDNLILNLIDKKIIYKHDDILLLDTKGQYRQMFRANIVDFLKEEKITEEIEIVDNYSYFNY